MVGITNSMDVNVSKLQEIVEDRGAWLVTVHGVPSVRHDLVAKPLMPALHGFSSSHVMDVRAGQ